MMLLAKHLWYMEHSVLLTQLHCFDVGVSLVVLIIFLSWEFINSAMFSKQL